MAVSGKTKKELIEEINALGTRLKELEHSKDECKKAQEESIKSKAFLDNVINTLDDPFFVKDQEHRWFMLNDAACKVMGRPREELIGKSDYDLFPREQADVFWEKDKLVLETGEKNINEEKITWHGKVHTISTKKSLYTDPVTSKKFITGTIRDITKLKQSEELLRESEDKLEAMLGSLAEHMSMMDKDLNIIWANETAMNIFGDDIVGRKCYEAYHQRNKPCEPYPCLTLKAFQDGKVHEHDTQVVDKDGSIRYFHCNANVALRDEQGKPTAVLEISEDVTDQKLAEEALRESESSYRAVVENSAEGIVVVQDQMLQFVNPALMSMTGYSERELLTRPFIEFIHPDHRDWAIGIHIKRLKGEEVPPTYEFKILDKQGNVKWLENNGILFEWRDRPATLNFLRDVTDRKKAEQAIWASESEKRSILNVISDHILFHDTDLLIRWGNEAAARSIGMTQRELAGCYCYELWHGRSEPCERCPVLRAIETRSHTEGITITPDGKLWEIVGEPVFDRDGEIRGAIEIGRDLTNRKKAEAALAESEQRFRKFFENEPEYCYMVSPEGIILEANNAALSALGYAKEELVGKSIESFYAPESCERARQLFAQWKKTGEIRDEEMVIITRNGDKRNVLLSSTQVLSEDGKLLHSVSIQRDITERKKAEEGLRESEQRLKILFESAPDAIYLNDLKGNFVDGNKATEQIMGYAKDELIGKSFVGAGLLSSEHLLRAVANLEQNAMGKPTGPDEFTLKRKDGSSIDVEIRTFPVSIGEQILSLGIARDISARKTTERKLFEHRAQLKSLASELSLTEERERHRLATDLHDQISQALVISRIKLQQLHASVSSAEIAGPLEEACNNIDRIIQDTRTLTFDLSSPILYELGFEAAVSEWLEEQVGKKHGIKTQFEDDGRPKPLQDDIRILLFRNVRELLINIVKHADAQNVKVSISRIGQQICISVEDDGVGFNPSEVASKAGFGIFSIHERLEQLTGHIEIESEPGQGTKIMMTAPLKSNKVSRQDKIKPR